MKTVTKTKWEYREDQNGKCVSVSAMTSPKRNSVAFGIDSDMIGTPIFIYLNENICTVRRAEQSSEKNQEQT